MSSKQQKSHKETCNKRWLKCVFCFFVFLWLPRRCIYHPPFFLRIPTFFCWNPQKEGGVNAIGRYSIFVLFFIFAKLLTLLNKWNLYISNKKKKQTISFFANFFQPTRKSLKITNLNLNLYQFIIAEFDFGEKSAGG